MIWLRARIQPDALPKRTEAREEVIKVGSALDVVSSSQA